MNISHPPSNKISILFLDPRFDEISSLDDSSIDREFFSNEVPFVVELSSSSSNSKMNREMRTVTNNHEHTLPTPSFGEVWNDIELKIVESISFMRRVITNTINPAESNTLWDLYIDRLNYCFKFLKKLSYEVVLEKFMLRLSDIMNLIMKLKKHAHMFLTRSKILAFSALE
ncbi:unnamed protein product [Lathyrus oleraceus]